MAVTYQCWLNPKMASAPYGIHVYYLGASFPNLSIFIGTELYPEGKYQRLLAVWSIFN